MIVFFRVEKVCFKHPDLLKQAREACVAKRRELCTAARARRFDRSSTSSAALGSSIATSVAYDTQDEQERSKIPFTSLMNLEEEYTLGIQKYRRPLLFAVLLFAFLIIRGL